MSKGCVDIAFTTAYFDFYDYDKPIKTYLSSSDNLYFIENYTSWTQFMVQTNNAKTSDNRFMSDNTDSLTFYSTKNKAQRTGNPNSFQGSPIV